MIKTDFPEDFRFPELTKEPEEQGFDPWKTRLVCVAVNASETVEVPMPARRSRSS